MTQNKIKDLSIQVNLNGLSFCILNRTDNSIEYINAISFDQKLTPFETLKRLKAELASNTVFSSEFNSINVIHYNELATLVPKALYDEANNAEYLKFNSKILKTDFIASDELSSYDIVSVYVPYVNINNYIFETFGAFSYTHASTVFLNAADKIITDTHNSTLIVNIQDTTMQVLVKGKSLEFYNYFEFTTPEDFIYYLLFTCEQKQLDPENLALKLCGTVNKEDALYTIAYKYIRHVDIVEDSQHFLIKNSFDANHIGTI
ncbi:DUF3822 family protein [Winogradskyella jejuensis]|uniref:DUF3822 domain-containing protein n=1 Tax=Winogradskyella jejuensis TaxID=1089305 RepID=A0A1M5TKS4_9FLAO|nr:DUF3822 family protein [Winogradskyella jejuensis]SHH51377.1 Protein of unknown function [Winogradskyella jejuensis]